MFTDEEPKTIGCGISQIVADFELPNPVASQRLIELEDNNPHFIEDVDVVIETVDVTRLATNIAQGIIAFPFWTTCLNPLKQCMLFLTRKFLRI